MTESKETLLTFPCDFTIKVFGVQSDEFEAAVLTIIHQHIPSFSDLAIRSKNSAKGNYCALSLTVHVDSKAELDAIYKDLSASPHVIMAL